jgi:hypothetical protein
VKRIPDRIREEDRQCYSFNQFADIGFLHYINTELLGPLGYALCLDYADGYEEPTGWSLHGFEGPIEVDVDEKTKKKYRGTMRLLFAMAKDHGRMPLEEHTESNLA